MRLVARCPVAYIARRHFCSKLAIGTTTLDPPFLRQAYHATPSVTMGSAITGFQASGKRRCQRGLMKKEERDEKRPRHVEKKQLTCVKKEVESTLDDGGMSAPPQAALCHDIATEQMPESGPTPSPAAQQHIPPAVAESPAAMPIQYSQIAAYVGPSPGRQPSSSDMQKENTPEPVAGLDAVAGPSQAVEEVVPAAAAESQLATFQYKVNEDDAKLVASAQSVADIPIKVRNKLYAAMGRAFAGAEAGKFYIPPDAVSRYVEASSEPGQLHHTTGFRHQRTH